MATETAQKQEDDEWIRRAAGGDREAFAMLVERHYGKIYAIAWKFCGNKEDAEDVAQNVAIKLARVMSSYRFEAAFTTWLYRLTVNAAKDHIRQRGRIGAREVPLKPEITPVAEENPEKKLEMKEVLAAVDALPEAQRDVILLVCWEGLSHKEAADVLDCAETTVSWRLFEARKKLGKIVQTKTVEDGK
ncbi:MAG: RNA polymerase sigma factor [Pseudomonadota bacterium]|nr:RNA polymerase sigma factor [Pseudomonadota bacterium]QKK06272.1 MAG: RNA polymerase sigma factor [Pseudomonadota bacterium]